MALTTTVDVKDGVAKITLDGELDAAAAGQFKADVEKAALAAPKKLVLYMDKLKFMASAGLRVLIFAKQKMGTGVDIFVIAPQAPVLGTLTMSGFHHSVFIKDSYTD